jgi:hypothetical protein
MPGTTLLRLRRRLASAFEEELQAVEATPASAESAREIDALVRECLNHAREFGPMWHAILEMLESADDVDYQALGQELKGVFERGIHLLRAMKVICEQYQQNELTIPSAGNLNDALRELEMLSASIFKNWPWPDDPGPAFDPQQIAEAREAIARGDYQTLEELIGELRGAGS